MKRVLRIIFIIATLASSNSLFAQVQGKFGINQNTLDINAAIEVESTSKGVLLPRLTTAQQNAMVSPTNGMLIYYTDSACFVLRRVGVWRSLCAANGGEAWSTLGNAGTSNTTNFLGTTDNVPLSIRVNNLRTLTFGTDTSFYRGNVGNTRGTNAVDLQSSRNGVSQVASGGYAVLGGGRENTVSGISAVVSGGYQNSAAGNQSAVLGGYLNVVTNDYSTIGGGNANNVSGDYAVISGGSSNTASGSNANIGGGSSNNVSALRSTVGGGFGNTVSTTYSNINGGSTNTINSTGSIGTIGGGYGNSITGAATYTVIGGGNNNTISVDRATIAGGQGHTISGNAGTIGGGYHNTVSNSYATLAGGADNVVSGGNAALVGGNLNTASGGNSFIGGGSSNTASGTNASIIGGSGLTLSGNNSLGFNTIGTLNIAASNTFYLGDADMWLGNVGGNARELRFYSPNSSATYTGAYYSSLKAGVQAANTPYILPTAYPSVSNSLLTSTTGGTMSWSNLNNLAWSLTGNSGTVDGTNFIGTTDNIPLSMRVNNQKAGRIDALGVAILGYQAGNVNTATNLTALGYQAGYSHTTGNNNSFIGYQSGYSTTTGIGNTAMGANAFRANTTGGNNTAVGNNTLTANTTADFNTAVGQSALSATTTGGYNTAFGQNTLANTTTGSNNTALGQTSLSTNTTGFGNVAVGQGALTASTTADVNTAVGSSAMRTNTTGAQNVAVGTEALNSSTTASYNVAVGRSNSYTTTTGGNNTSVGFRALFSNTTGANNATLGYQSGLNITTGSNNTLLGYQADVATGTFSNATAIGANASVGASNSLVLGNSVNVGINTGTPQYKLDIDAQTGSSGNPLRLLGLNAGATSDSIITSANGVLRRLSIAQVLANAWNITGNSGTSVGTNVLGAAVDGNYWGTSDAVNLVVGTNGIKRMIFDQNGSAYGGTSTTTTAGLNSLAWGNGNASTGDNALTVGLSNVNSSKSSFVFGQSNNLSSGGVQTNRGTILGGGNNTVSGGQTYNSIINGSQITVTGDCFESIIIGYLTNVTASQKVVVSGQGHTVTNATGSAVLGNFSTALSPHGFIAGSQNAINASAEYSVALGQSNTVAATHLNSFAIGKSVTTTTTAQLMAGFTGGYRFHTNNATTSSMAIDNVGNVGIGINTPNQQLEITAAMRMPATTSSTTGVIYKGANRFIHDYKPAANDGNNTFIGVNAGNFTMTSATSFLASGNTGVGTNALTALVDAGYNTALGFNTLQATTTGSYNTGIGAAALTANTTGVGNTAIGNGALQVNTTANSNTAIGNGALSFNTTGAANTATGESALNKNTTGIQNTGLGQSALRENTTGSNNVAVGLSALQVSTTASNNVAVGTSALVNNLTGASNVALGGSALSSTTSSNNVSVGHLAGTGTTSGGNNTFIGYNTASTNTTGSANTTLGYQANVSSGALTNATAIGNGASVNASNKIRLGNASVTVVETQGSFVTVSDRRLKTNINDNFIGLNFIKAIRPVHYELKAQKGLIYDGFIAQEIDSILQKQGITNFSGLIKPQNTEGGYYTVSYATFVVPLVNAVKELDVKGEALSQENAILKAELEKMKKDNVNLKASVEKNSQDIETIKAALVKKNN